MKKNSGRRAGTARYYDIFQTWALDLHYYSKIVDGRDSDRNLRHAIRREVEVLQRRRGGFRKRVYEVLVGRRERKRKRNSPGVVAEGEKTRRRESRALRLSVVFAAL